MLKKRFLSDLKDLIQLYTQYTKEQKNVRYNKAEHPIFTSYELSRFKFPNLTTYLQLCFYKLLLKNAENWPEHYFTDKCREHLIYKCIDIDNIIYNDYK